MRSAIAHSWQPYPLQYSLRNGFNNNNEEEEEVSEEEEGKFEVVEEEMYEIENDSDDA